MSANQLLDHLPAAELRRILVLGAHVPLHSGQSLQTQGLPLRALLFPVRGFVCLVTPLDQHESVQVGMVGREGVLGAESLLGLSTSPVEVVVQEGGQAWSLPVVALRRALPRNPGLRRLLSRYLLVQLRHAVSMAACLHFHPLQARLARWLLMGQDRAEGDGFAVTQEDLAHLLGVRRVGVTLAAGSMQKAGLIQYHRGWIRISDRPGLRELACSCYAQDCATYLLGMNFPPDHGLDALKH
ncbi:Crp/Fnr family transcriptional regulator [Roseateles cellulosilyticus]|uniref:Crp/Fnr family transcriptional regulator n=1 Tax=Pelomonas cellulosilytica TaxID=2906762 RepID=A0ABS8Y4K4_9BURK|nr:Crp/Fnr family transcriptional regulator [Pelomonas sp. P8]MCE4558241.1 Crp/Fnr family transcriptional regulator [Pelomonas sp. P8]